MKTYFELRESLQNEQAHYAFDTQKAASTFQKKVNGMPMNIVKAGTGKYYIVDLRPGTKQADQEKAAKIAVSIGLSESYSIEEKFSFPKPPFKDMHIVGFSGKLKQTQQSGTDENVGPAVLKDVKAALKIVAKHLKTQGMRYKEDEVLVGPMNVKGFKPGEGDSDFSIDIYPGFPGKNPSLPSGKKEGDINLNDMVKDLGKLKSFVNFPRSDWEVNYGRPSKD